MKWAHLLLRIAAWTCVAFAGGVAIYVVAASASLRRDMDAHLKATAASAVTQSEVKSAIRQKVDPVFVEASDLLTAYGENELAADKQYRGKYLGISGNIVEIAVG